MAFCRNCGKEVDDGTKFCAGCGAATEATADVPVTTTTVEATNSFSGSSSSQASALDKWEWDIKGLSNKWAWCLAFVPIMGSVLGGIFVVVADKWGEVWASFALNIGYATLFFLFYLLDKAELKKRNIKLGRGWVVIGILLCGFLVEPIYLFNRARNIGKYGYAIASLVALVVGVLLLGVVLEFSETAKLADSTPVQQDSTETAQSAVPAQQNNTGSAQSAASGGKIDNRLVGKWCDWGDGDGCFVFRANGTFLYIGYEYDDDGDETKYERIGRWGTVENKITMTFSNGETTVETYSIKNTDDRGVTGTILNFGRDGGVYGKVAME